MADGECMTDCCNVLHHAVQTCVVKLEDKTIEDAGLKKRETSDGKVDNCDTSKDIALDTTSTNNRCALQCRSGYYHKHGENLHLSCRPSASNKISGTVNIDDITCTRASLPCCCLWRFAFLASYTIIVSRCPFEHTYRTRMHGHLHTAS